MFKFKSKNSPSEQFKKLGSSVAHNFIIGMQKATIDELKRKLFEPYRLPTVYWVLDSEISFLKNEFEYLKRWYD